MNYDELNSHLRSADPLKFKAKKSYVDQLKAAVIKTGCPDVVNTYSGVINEKNIILCIMNFSFIGGSMGSVVGEKLISDKRVPLISFTGSTKMGRHVSETVASRFGKCILELGGNNAMIVDESATLSLAVPAIVFGAVGTAGQRCTSTRRVIVHENIYDELKNKLLSAYDQVKIGDPLDSETLII